MPILLSKNTQKNSKNVQKSTKNDKNGTLVFKGAIIKILKGENL